MNLGIMGIMDDCKCDICNKICGKHVRCIFGTWCNLTYCGNHSEEEVKEFMTNQTNIIREKYKEGLWP